MQYKRIMILGRPGSGKSTFALQLQQFTQLPIYHLDKYFFILNWAKRDNNEFMHMQHDMVNSKAWIVGGNCTRSLQTRYSRADICLYFNYLKIVCLWYMFKRLFQNCDHIDDRADNCAEEIRWRIVVHLINIITNGSNDVKNS